MASKAFTNNQTEVEELRRFSADLGRDQLLVQASTGNTSVKVDETLWIKASGTWLQNAERDDIFVAVPLSDIHAACSQETELTSLYPTCCPTAHGTGLRASIETAMHGILPRRVVAHVHSVNAIAWAVREDAPLQLAVLLDGLIWEWIPYVPSGWRLAREIEQALSRSSDANVFVLGNHGLVICGESCSEVQELLSEVERRLSIHPRPGPEPDWKTLKERTHDSGWLLPQSRAVHALATDGCARQISSQGLLHPCQAIFFGKTPLLSSFAKSPSSRPFLILDRAGVLFSDSMTDAEREILTGFAEVVQRIDARAPVRYLTDNECQQVLNGDTYHYQQLAFAQ